MQQHQLLLNTWFESFNHNRIIGWAVDNLDQGPIDCFLDPKSSQGVAQIVVRLQAGQPALEQRFAEG